MSLDQLDAFLVHAGQDPDLRERLHDHQDPPELEEFLVLAHQAGYAVAAEDVIAAQERAEAALSDDDRTLVVASRFPRGQR